MSVTTAATPAVAPPLEENTTTRPDHIPEKFWKAEKGEINVEAKVIASIEDQGIEQVAWWLVARIKPESQNGSGRG